MGLCGVRMHRTPLTHNFSSFCFLSAAAWGLGDHESTAPATREIESSEVGSESRPDPRISIRNCFPGCWLPASPQPASSIPQSQAPLCWKGDGAQNSPQSKMNQIQEKQGRHPEELLPLTSWLPRSEAISFGLFHEQWVSKQRSGGRAGANFRAGGVAHQLPGEAGWAALMSDRGARMSRTFQWKLDNDLQEGVNCSPTHCGPN